MEPFVDRRGVLLRALPDGVDGTRRWWAPSRLAPVVSLVALLLVFPVGRWIDPIAAVPLYFLSYMAMHLTVIVSASFGSVPRHVVVRRDEVSVDGVTARVRDVVVSPAGRYGAARVADLVTDLGRVTLAFGSAPPVEALAEEIAASVGVIARAPGENERALARRIAWRSMLALGPATLVVWAVFAAVYGAVVWIAVREPDLAAAMRPWLLPIGASVAVFPHVLLGGIGVWLVRTRADRFPRRSVGADR